MQDFNIPGMILVGHAGTGKSEIAKGAGNVAQCPVISIDTGAMKDSLVGGSELRIRAAMDVFKAVSQGKGLFIATCNKISSLPPELRRRFTLGTFFVDLPTEEERAMIWPIWIKRFDIKPAKQPLPECDGWTGAEIKACCETAYRTGLTLKQAAAFVVPVIKSAPEAVEALRKLASNRFIDASNARIYKYEPAATATQTGGRKIEL
jgi:SpoVK/Ycf46/Vps4 family AAA+-type ATPase